LKLNLKMNTFLSGLMINWECFVSYLLIPEACTANQAGIVCLQKIV